MSYTKFYPETDTTATTFVDNETVLAAQHMNAIKTAIRGDESFLKKVDDSINNLENGLVNYNYDTPGSSTYTYEASGVSYSMTASRQGTRITLNGHHIKNSVYMKAYFCGAVKVHPSSASGQTPVVLKDKHRYRLRVTEVSGTASHDGAVTPQFFRPGSTARLDPELYYTDANYSTGIVVGVFINRNFEDGISFDNYVFDLTLEDITYDGNIAPVETTEARSAHSAGELLMVKGKLYKTTSAVSIGNTIADYATETSVAAQLAALEARIAALES